MTVNHDVVGSSPTGGVYSKRSIIDLFYFLEKALLGNWSFRMYTIPINNRKFLFWGCLPYNGNS